MKKILSLLLCMALSVSIVPFAGLNAFEKVSAEGVFTTVESNVTSITADGVTHESEIIPWDGKVADEAPSTTVIDGKTFYQIEDAADLAWYANKVNKGNSSSDSTNRESSAILMNDIDLNGHNWYDYRIGQSYYFAGTFDGQGHTIYNLYIESSKGGAGGFFGSIGVLGKAATIKNVNFADAMVVSTYTGDYAFLTGAMTSVVCGYMTAKDTLIENVKASGTITVKSSSHSVIGAGSIVGRSVKGTIKNCYSDVDFELANAKNLTPDYFSGTSKIYGIGGIVGVWSATSDAKEVEGTITQCVYEGNINAPQNSRVGGIVGNISTYRYFSFNRCSSTGNITGYRQVGGIVGWAYDGNSIYHSPLYMYSSATVTAKTATSSYAAGIANGMRGDSITYPIAFTGDVKVDAIVNGSKAPEFNENCGLLFTTNTALDKGYWHKLYIAYIPRYCSDNTEKHIIGHKQTKVYEADNVKACTEEEFRDGTVLELFEKSGKDQNFTNVPGLNDGFVVAKWYAENPISDAHTYYLDNESIDAEFDAQGYCEFEIAPVGEAVVTVDNDEKKITQKGTYKFEIENTRASIRVDGKALITKDVRKFKKPEVITSLTATPIKVSFPDTVERDVLLALYRDGNLEELVYNKNVQPEMVNGEYLVSAVIDLEGIDVTNCTLKAFLWEGGNLAPVEEFAYIGKPMGDIATADEKAQAVKVVAQSYLDRGENIQYDNTLLNSDGYTRYEFGKAPEEFTSQSNGYMNEVSFCYNVYKEALDIELPKTFNALVTNSTIKVAETDAASFDIGTLKVGDIIAFSSDSGNSAMIYTGDNTVVYASGGSYDYSYGEDFYEAEGAVKSDNINNILGNISDSVTVLRPSNIKSDIILPQRTISRVANLDGIVAEKTASHREGITAELGDEITYTFTIENKNDEAVNLTISDILPAHTELIDGCNNVSGSRLYWDITLGAGDTRMISYTVEVTSEYIYYGEFIENGNAKINGVKVPCADIRIGRTFNDADSQNLKESILAMDGSIFKGTTLLKWIYVAAFSRSFSLTGTASDILKQIFVDGGGSSAGSESSGEEVGAAAVSFVKMAVPSLYGGRTVGENAENILGTKRAGAITRDHLVTGDILLTQKNSSDSGKLYIYNGSEMVELTNGKEKVDDTDLLLESLLSYDKFIVLRPSISLDTFVHFKDSYDVELTPEQDAIVSTARAYFLRGGSYQYDDTRLTPKVDSSVDEYRWMIRKAAPEDVTTAEWSYSNCAAFTYDCYYFGLDYDIKTWSTDMYHQSTPKKNMVYKFAKTGTETEAEKEAIKAEVLSILQPGDVINIKRETGTGHAMLYIGNETILHSSGSNYNYTNATETYEPTIRYRSALDLFQTSETCDIFGVVETLDIIRPLNSWTGTIPQNTQNRMANMDGIRAEKLSSHTSSMTVNPGDEMTFTFSIFNTNDTSVTFDVKDVIPSNTEYISGADKVEGNSVSWKVTVAPEETETVSYKVRVKDSATMGSYIDCSKGTVGGVIIKCPDVKIGRTLVADEQADIKATINNLKGSDLSGIELANEIYETAFGVENIFADYNEDGSFTNADITDATFETTTLKTGSYIMNTDTDCGKMIALPLYGGRIYYTERWENIRTRLGQKNKVITGDILVEKKSDGTINLYIFDGENMLDLNDNLAETDTNTKFIRIMASDLFAVLRPSLVME